MIDELAARYYKQIVKLIKEENMTKTIDMIKRLLISFRHL